MTAHNDRVMKYLISIFIFSIISFVILARPKDQGDTTSKDNAWLTQVNEYKEEIRKIKMNSRDILQKLEVYHLRIVEEEFDHFTNNLIETEKVLSQLDEAENLETKNRFFDLYESTLESYEHLLNLYDFYTQLQEKKEEWSDEYFNLWEQTYALKIKIDNIYVKEEKMNVHYGGMSDYKYQSVRKRNLYEACINIYNASLDNLKSTGDCDHYTRIQILNRLLPVMRKCDKLSFAEDTRDLEKDLRKEEDTEKMAQLILDFETEGE